MELALRKVLLLPFVFLSVSVLAAEPDCEPGGLDDDERLTELSAVSHESDPAASDFDALGQRMLASFGSLWCDREYGADLSEASDAVVSIRLRAARSTAFYARPDWVLERLRAVVDEARSRGLADSDDLNNLFTAYQVAGRFERARALRDRYPDAGLPEVPRVVAAGEPPSDDARKVWRVDGEGNRLRGDWLTLHGPRLLIVTSPGCSFCRAAVKSLLADDVLSPLMRENAVWLAGPSMNNSFAAVARWNGEHPDAPTLLVDDADDWPVDDLSFTPQFHFMRDGEVVHSLTGWRGGPDALGALAEGFDRLGLLDVSQLPDDVFAYADKPSYTRGCPERDEARERIRERAEIGTREQLERHLEGIEAGDDSPLEKLSTEGRKRFVAGMRFGEDGRLMGLNFSELEAQLEPREIYTVTSLFGRQYGFAGVLFDADLLSEEERELKAMIECRG